MTTITFNAKTSQWDCDVGHRVSSALSYCPVCQPDRYELELARDELRQLSELLELAGCDADNRRVAVSELASRALASNRWLELAMDVVAEADAAGIDDGFDDRGALMLALTKLRAEVSKYDPRIAFDRPANAASSAA